MSMNKSVTIKTLGCRVNQYESCAIAELLRKNGITVSNKDDSDYYIVNTCAVTAESERKSRQLVRRCAQKGRVLVIGCASQLSFQPYDVENVIYIGGNTDKSAVVDAIVNETSKCMAVVSMQGAAYENLSLNEKNDIFSECRAFIKIQDGCNGKCTYCIIPKCRGGVRSRDFDDILQEAKRLVKLGYKEIILTGIEVGAYNKASLADLIAAISSIDGIQRLRLGSLSPNVINENFLRAASESKAFMPHIHLSLQSCCDKTLRAMKRPYTKQKVYEKVEMIRKYIPDCMISADIIVGFPNESDADFIETLTSVSELNLFHVHSFPYSERKGTEAAEMQGSVPKHIRAERNAALISECSRVRSKIFDSALGTQKTVLLEKIKDGYAYGHTEEFFEARCKNAGLKVGDIVTVKVCAYDGMLLETTLEEQL